MTSTEINVVGLFLNIAGTIILAISLGRYLLGLHMMTMAHELFLLAINQPPMPIVQFTGTDTHVDKGRRRAKWLSFLGLTLVIAGFVAQVWALLQAGASSLEEPIPNSR